jgi:hypothetical protein
VLYDALCIDAFKKNHIDIVYLDVSELFLKIKVHQTYEFIIQIDSYKTLENMIKKHADEQTYFNIQMHFESRFWKIFRLVKIYNCKTSIFEIGYGPNIVSAHKILGYLQNPLKLLHRLSEKILVKLLLSSNFLKTDYDVVFSAGHAAREIAFNKAKQIVEINFIDYEYFQKYLYEERASQYGGCIIFLDSYMAHHEDISFAINSKRLDPDVYINALNNFFDKIEYQYNKEIVIAAHPKSNYSEGTFKHRKIVKNQTLDLVCSADFILSHHSTSVSYAVLSYKSILFIYTDEMEALYKAGHIQFMKTLADVLNMPCINIDHIEGVTIEKVSTNHYDKYRYDYLVSKTSELFLNEEIITSMIIRI